MKTTLTDNSLDLSEFDRLETEYNNRIAELQAQIDILNAENRSLISRIANATVEEAAALRQQYNANRSRIEELTRQQEGFRQKLTDLRAAREEAAAGEDVPTDDYYRIPAIMNDCKTAFDLTWQEEGHWEDYTYVRTATSGSMDAVITFKATLSIARKPKYFLGIKIHRPSCRLNGH